MKRIKRGFYANTSKIIANVGLEGLTALSDDIESLPRFIIPILDQFATAVTLTTLNIYKRYIDPYKKGKCAHRLTHGGLSCSDYIKEIVSKHGAIAATPLIRQRYAECREAYLLLNLGNISAKPLKSYGDLHCHLDV